MKRAFIALALIFAIFMSGCIQMESESTCVGQKATSRCYHNAAIAYAAIHNDSFMAYTMCNKIAGNVVQSFVSGSMRDRCFMDAAEIMKDTGLCSNIENAVVHETCMRKATPPPPIKVCGLSPVIFVVLFAAIFVYCGRKPKAGSPGL